MNREETKKIIMVLTYTYPNFKPQDMSLMVDIWTEMLSEYSYEKVSNALKQYIKTDTSGFAPVIGQLVEIMTPKVGMNGNEAWSLVYKAICNSTYNSQKEFDKLPYLVQKAVGCAENLRQMAIDEEFNASVMQSHFIRVYNEEVRRDNEQQKIPEELRISNNERMMIDEKHYT